MKVAAADARGSGIDGVADGGRGREVGAARGLERGARGRGRPRRGVGARVYRVSRRRHGDPRDLVPTG